jgi:hypothetical protein
MTLQRGSGLSGLAQGPSTKEPTHVTDTVRFMSFLALVDLPSRFNFVPTRKQSATFLRTGNRARGRLR